MHPKLNKFDCAVVYGYHKKHDDFDRIMDTDRTFFGYFDDVLQLMPLFVLRDASKYLLYAGLFFHIMGIEFSQSTSISLMAVLNFLMFLPSLYMPFKRFGPDYTAYIAQAGQFWSG